MVTKNYKNILVVGLQSASQIFGCARGVDVTGAPFYTANKLNYPYNTYATLTLDADSEGISVGTGGTAATEEDFQLEATITGGIMMQMSAIEPGCDAPGGNPFVIFRITVTNTGSEEITVREIGYKQRVPGVRYPKRITSNATSNKICLIDRTVLEPPLTLQSGDAGVIQYKLSTIPTASRTIGGVEIASWEYGTDEQIAAMLDAAHRGDIDLQTDAGWKIGALRVSSIAAFTDGAVAQTAQPICLAISSFDEYEGCGNVMQVDLLDTLIAPEGILASSSEQLLYGESRMYTTTLPAMVGALPDWLRTRLRTFSVKVSTGGDTPTLLTVPDNKLALRAASEIYDADPSGVISWNWEGNRIGLYRNMYFRKKARGMEGDLNIEPFFWTRTRSPYQTNYYLAVNSASVRSISGASSNYGFAPFGCL